jgi:hypothetical protein
MDKCRQDAGDSDGGNGERPIVCMLETSHDMFRVIRAKGKALTSGGFGVSISEKKIKQQKQEEAEGDDGKSYKCTEMESIAEASIGETKTCDPSQYKSSSNTSIFLFVEEVLFLHERGFLRAMDEEGRKSLDTSQLYQLVSLMGLSLSTYRVYSHLRCQDFRVLRHAPSRLNMLRLQEQQHMQSTAETIRLRRQVRESIQTAEVPSLFTNRNNINDRFTDDLKIGWDVYYPDCNFAKTHPGKPDFYVAMTFYNVLLVPFSKVRHLLQEECHSIPLKLATVSDSGTVVMFGVTGSDIPPINKVDEE